MTWHWQQAEWPEFRFVLTATESLEREFLLKSGSLLGASSHLSNEDRNQIRVQLLSDEALLTSRIEGEILDRDGLQSSIQRQFGVKEDLRKVLHAERGISEFLVDGYRGFDEPLDAARLLKWHAMLMQGRRDIEVVAFRRGGDPMQVVSGPIHDPRVHFKAPPSTRVPDEIKGFFVWWNHAGAKLHCLARASIAHLYFESIHPFEDGNGRIGRALSELAISQSLGQPVILSLSRVIESNRGTYYDELGRASRQLEVDRWISYFSNTILQAQSLILQTVEFLIAITRFFERLRGNLNSRQEKVLLRMFRERLDSFKGGLSSSNYRAIANTTTATTTRDLSALVEKGTLRRTGERKHTRKHTRYHFHLES